MKTHKHNNPIRVALLMLLLVGLLAACAAPSAQPAASSSTSASESAAAPTAGQSEETSDEAQTGEAIYIGVSGPLTGPNARYGEQWKRALT